MKDMVSINKQCLSEKRKTNQNFFKGSLNSDGQQFHQYQQNKQSPLTSTTITSHLNSLNI
jgi:hypothetical protein